MNDIWIVDTDRPSENNISVKKINVLDILFDSVLYLNRRVWIKKLEYKKVHLFRTRARRGRLQEAPGVKSYQTFFETRFSILAVKLECL